MGAGGYESWFVSARDPVSPRALWIRHTRHRPRVGRESVALWCTVIDRDGGQQPAVIKEVLGAFPPGRLQLAVATDDDDPVAVTYTDPRGGTRTVRHAARAAVELTLRRPGQRELTLTGGRGAYEFGTSHDMPGIVPQPLPEG